VKNFDTNIEIENPNKPPYYYLWEKEGSILKKIP
jgi:hypothetical protein